MRRARAKLHFKAFLSASGLALFLLVLTFFFYDGPLHPPAMIPSAMATDDPVSQALESLLASHPKQEAPISPVAGLKPELEWSQIGLDQNLVKLKVLKTPATLAETTQKTGSEAFEYAAYLYSQMAQEIKDSELSAHLKRLSVEAQALGSALRQASQIRFDGPPSEDMNHLKARLAIINRLQPLSRSPLLITARYDQQGALLNEEQGHFMAGQGLTNYLNTVQQIQSLPAANQYPETLSLISMESELLSEIAQSITLRWESTMQCPSHCDDIATFMRIYLRQSLPEQTLITARI